MSDQRKTKPKSAKKSATAKSAASANPPKAYVTSRFEKRVGKLGLENEWENIEKTIKKVAKAFGKPHEHEGLGIRRLHGKDDTYECRWSGGGQGGLHYRLVFEIDGDPKGLYFIFMGNHRDVVNFLKS